MQAIQQSVYSLRGAKLCTIKLKGRFSRTEGTMRTVCKGGEVFQFKARAYFHFKNVVRQEASELCCEYMHSLGS